MKISRRLEIPLVVTNDVHYTYADDVKPHDILLCIQTGKKMSDEDILDMAIFVIPIAIISARLYYVLFSLDYFLENPSEIFQIKDGGLAIYGGIIGGLLTIIVMCKIKKIKVNYTICYLHL